MKVNRLHDFRSTSGAAIKLQTELASQVSTNGTPIDVKLIAGVDVSAGRQGNTGRAAIVVMQYPSMEIVEESVHEGEVTTPYIPGLLSFRELPLILPALEKLETIPDLFIVDGQGIAHPRRLGIAAHLGLFTGIASIGCAKSRLYGEHTEVPEARGSFVELIDKNEVIGHVVRTKEGCKPVYISVGHKINLESATAWVLKLCSRYRLPEPVRRAHLAAGKHNRAG